MYAGYNLELDKQFFREWKFKATNHNSHDSLEPPNNSIWSGMFLDSYSDLGKKHLENNKNKCRQKISELFLQDNILDGSAIQEEWFDTFDVDVFISHSHADEGLANALAGWLNETLGLRCFIDSNIWGYFNDLINAIIGNNTPTEQERSNVAVLVHTMLQIALQEMIDKSESVIFLNTENSMMALEKDLGKRKYTLSPWIYHELVVTRLIEKNTLVLSKRE